MDILISGASSGIGHACAAHLGALGHNVWAGVRTPKSFDELSRLRGVRAVFLDVRDEHSIEECLHRVGKESGVLHALINNAGIAVTGPVEAVKMADWREQFEINFFGAVRLTQGALPLLRESKGRVVNMSSMSGRIALPFFGPYAASKFALEAMSDSLRREVECFGMKVAIIEPGPIATPIWDKARGQSEFRIGEYNAEITHLYGQNLSAFAKRVDDSARKADPVHLVIEAIEHALFSSHPRTRYPVGRQSRYIAPLLKFIPDRWLDRRM